MDGPLWQRSNVELAGVRARVPGHHDFPSSIAPPCRPSQRSLPAFEHPSSYLIQHPTIAKGRNDFFLLRNLCHRYEESERPQIFCSQNAFLLPFNSWNTVIGIFLRHIRSFDYRLLLRSTFLRGEVRWFHEGSDDVPEDEYEHCCPVDAERDPLVDRLPVVNLKHFASNSQQIQ